MITNFKIFENLSLSKKSIVEIETLIEEEVFECTFDMNIAINMPGYYNFDDIDECPFSVEIAIIHQKDYISDIFWKIWRYTSDPNLDSVPDNDDYITTYLHEKVSLKDFFKVYNNLLQKSKTTILNSILNDPKLYDKWGDLIDPKFVEIPDWIINARKYNL